MDIEKSLAIVKALAEGTNPFTGEVLDAAHVCQQPDAVRALVHAVAELERIARKERALQRSRLTLPENTGKAWSIDEDRMLLTRFRNGLAVKDMAAMHNRTAGAIRARLEKLGQVTDAAPMVQAPPSEGLRRN